MSRRKQSKPRQIKRSLGDLEEGEDNLPDDLSLSGDEGGASDQDDSAECDGSSPAFMPPYSEEPRTEDSPSAPDDEEDEKGPELSAEEDEGEAEPQWDGPDELCLSLVGGVSEVIAQRNLTPNTVWGPYSGHVHNKEKGKEQEGEVRGVCVCVLSETGLCVCLCLLVCRRRCVCVCLVCVCISVWCHAHAHL
ncbi:zinc finger protein ZFPM1-like isoform X1 [Anguilla rostrata]|uniref:zinc finger protein ZFPM1-like isoform X1 n=1 Tax=Anguilla rostrata TaxID=7938 RepID=UPI0030D4C001